MKTDPKRAAWRKSSYSGGDGGECVEVANLTPVIGVRDSKDPDAGHLSLARDQFAALLRTLRALD